MEEKSQVLFQRSLENAVEDLKSILLGFKINKQKNIINGVFKFI